MSSPALDLYQRHRLTLHDFHRMGEAGILPVEGRLELIEGEIIAKAPIGSRHAAIVTRANMFFVQQWRAAPLSPFSTPSSSESTPSPSRTCAEARSSAGRGVDGIAHPLTPSRREEECRKWE